MTKSVLFNNIHWLFITSIYHSLLAHCLYVDDWASTQHQRAVAERGTVQRERERREVFHFMASEDGKGMGAVVESKECYLSAYAVEGVPTSDHLKFRTVALPVMAGSIPDGHVAVQILLISVDPYVRTRMTGHSDGLYFPQFEVNEVHLNSTWNPYAIQVCRGCLIFVFLGSICFMEWSFLGKITDLSGNKFCCYHPCSTWSTLISPSRPADENAGYHRIWNWKSDRVNER